jgi:uncharacterized SAM-binding protein YcdF (DUF218 family)
MRLVAVLGYSGFRGRGLHAICLARLRHAESLAGDDDTVLLSGEAELMRDASTRTEVVLDSAAGTTRENARGVAAAAHQLGADEIVVVTSAWHARRARALVRAAVGPDVRVISSSPSGRPSLSLAARELVCLAVLPLHARGLARSREPGDQRVGGNPVRGARSDRG